MFYWLLMILSASLYGLEVKQPWVIYYGGSAQAEEFTLYDPVVLQDNSPIVLAIAKKKVVLGYLNVGEAEQENGWFSEIKAKSLLIEENLEWPGSWKVDLRNEFWTRHLLKNVIPSILSKGFTGLFLDQIDVALDLEEREPEKFKGMKQAAVKLIQAIRAHFPKIKLMLNRGYEILPQVGGAIDYELAETLYTFYDSKTQSYLVRSKEEFEWQLTHLEAAKKKFPHLILFSLDYWDPSDSEMIKKIYTIELEHSLRPYVSTPRLDKIVSPP